MGIKEKIMVSKKTDIVNAESWANEKIFKFIKITNKYFV